MKLTTIVATLACCLFLNTPKTFGDVLYWQVTEETKVDNNPIQQFLVPYPSTDDSWPAARVKMVSNNNSSSTILKIWSPDDDGVMGWQDGDWGVEPWDTGSGRWETGWVQSETGYDTIDRVQDIIQGDVLDVPPDVMEALFIMELGYNEWNDGASDYVWKTLAQSSPEMYKNLVGQHMYASGDIAPPTANSWSPNFYSVPEPTTFILLLLGFGILALRRKNGNR